MKNTLIAAALAVSAAFLVRAENIVGDWQGTLKAGPAELRLVLHVSKNSDGGLKATLDSIDQNANGIPVTSISLKDSRLNFSVDAVHGSYEGKFNAGGTAIEGSWSQGQSLPLVFRRTSAPPKTQHKPAAASDIDGTWSGILDTGGGELRLAFHITNTEDGLTATMDSLDQGAYGLPVTLVTRNGASIKLELKQIAGAFEGKIGAGLATMEGTWTQNGNTLPLALKRAKDRQ